MRSNEWRLLEASAVARGFARLCSMWEAGGPYVDDLARMFPLLSRCGRAYCRGKGRSAKWLAGRGGVL